MNDVSLKNISSINGSFNEPNNMSNLRRTKSKDRATSAKTATFDLSNLSKAVAPLSSQTTTIAKSTHHHHSHQSTSHGHSNLTNSFAISQSTSSLAKSSKPPLATTGAQHHGGDAKAPPFYPPGKTVKKSFIDSNSVYDFERATLYSTWTPLSDERANQKVKPNLKNKNLFVYFLMKFNCFV